MNDFIQWFSVAKDECQTLEEYAAKLEIVADKDKLREIMGDEVNHALIALVAACMALGLKVPTDGLENIEQIFEEGDE